MEIGKRIAAVLVILLLVIAVIALVIGVKTYIQEEQATYTDAEKSVEYEIIARACADIDQPQEGATIKLLDIEEVPFSDYDLYTYSMVVNGERYIVGVQRKGTYVHFVDVEASAK